MPAATHRSHVVRAAEHSGRLTERREDIEAMYTAEPDHVVAVLCPLGLLTGNYHAPLRAWLAQHHQLEWLIYLGSAAAQLLGVHLRFRMVLLRFSSVSRQFQKSFHAVW